MAPALRGELTWCQMFSEPGAGQRPGLAGHQGGAGRRRLVDQPGRRCGRRWRRAPTSASASPAPIRRAAARGHRLLPVDMRTGVDMRPLRELTGAELFNEVFLTDVFVPDDCLVGSPTGGWAAPAPRSPTSGCRWGGSSMGPGVEALFELAERGLLDDPLVADSLGADWSRRRWRRWACARRCGLSAAASRARGQRAQAARRRARPGVQEVGLELLGPRAAADGGPGASWVAGFLGNRACRSPAGPARSSATSSPSACWACRATVSVRSERP